MTIFSDAPNRHVEIGGIARPMRDARETHEMKLSEDQQLNERLLQ
jgi:hypothetical protein